MLAPLPTHLDRFGQHARNILRPAFLVGEAIFQIAQLLPLPAQEQATKFLELFGRIARGSLHERSLDYAPGTRNSFFKRSATSLNISARDSRPVMAPRICSASRSRSAFAEACFSRISSPRAFD